MARRYFPLGPVINNGALTANRKALEVGIAVRKTKRQWGAIAGVSHADILHLPMVQAALESPLATAPQVH